MIELRISLDAARLDADVVLVDAGGAQIARGTVAKAEDVLKLTPAAVGDAARLLLGQQAAGRLAELEAAATLANAKAKEAKDAKDAAAAAAAVWTTATVTPK